MAKVSLMAGGVEKETGKMSFKEHASALLLLIGSRDWSETGVCLILTGKAGAPIAPNPQAPAAAQRCPGGMMAAPPLDIVR